MLLWTLLAALKAASFYLWLLLRPVLGWFFIIVGLIGMPMPIMNGVIFLMIGVALVGHRNWLIRWSRVKVKLLVYWWAALRTPIVGFLGRWALRTVREISRQHRRLRWWWLERQKARQGVV